MPKDIVVNLTVAGTRDAAATYAVSVAQTFDAYLAAVAFAYEPVLPAIVGGGIPELVIEEQREENDKAAKTAVAQFEAAAKAVKHDTRVVPASLAGAADTFGEIARVYDLSIVGQSERDRVGPEELIVEGALFGSGRPVMVVPAGISQAACGLSGSWCAGMAGAMPHAPPAMPFPSCAAPIRSRWLPLAPTRQRPL